MKEYINNEGLSIFNLDNEGNLEISGTFKSKKIDAEISFDTKDLVNIVRDTPEIPESEGSVYLSLCDDDTFGKTFVIKEGKSIVLTENIFDANGNAKKDIYTLNVLPTEHNKYSIGSEKNRYTNGYILNIYNNSIDTNKVSTKSIVYNTTAVPPQIGYSLLTKDTNGNIVSLSTSFNNNANEFLRGDGKFAPVQSSVQIIEGNALSTLNKIEGTTVIFKGKGYKSIAYNTVLIGIDNSGCEEDAMNIQFDYDSNAAYFIKNEEKGNYKYSTLKLNEIYFEHPILKMLQIKKDNLVNKTNTITFYIDVTQSSEGFNGRKWVVWTNTNNKIDITDDIYKDYIGKSVNDIISDIFRNTSFKFENHIINSVYTFTFSNFVWAPLTMQSISSTKIQELFTK